MTSGAYRKWRAGREKMEVMIHETSNLESMDRFFEKGGEILRIMPSLISRKNINAKYGIRKVSSNSFLL